MPSSLSFHCMVCFEEFDSQTRYPVVLPCGHTYICVVCASKVDKCTECRQSLFNEDSSSNNHMTSSSNQSIYEQRLSRSYTSSSTLQAARSGRRPIITERPQPLSNSRQSSENQKVKLPLPKNVVLMSLIESSQLTSESSHDSIGHNMSLVGNHDNEDLKIIIGTDLATSSCGTYAVANKDGLDIVPTMSASMKEDTALLTGLGSPVVQSPSSAAIHLDYGDRIQVVTIVGKCAKLPRGHGYVHLKNSRDLVKVGGVLDKACAIECMLYFLSHRRNNIIEQKAQIETDAVKLMHELKETMNKVEDLTVIGAEAFDNAPSDELKLDKYTVSGSDSRDDILEKDESDEDSTRDDTDSPISCFMNSGKESSARRNSLPRSYHDTVHITRVSSAMRESAQSWRRRHGREANVHFRTGLSGHLGALGHHAHDLHHQVNVGLPKMSCHGGLTSGRSGKKINLQKLFRWS